MIFLQFKREDMNQMILKNYKTILGVSFVIFQIVLFFCSFVFSVTMMKEYGIPFIKEKISITESIVSYKVYDDVYIKDGNSNVSYVKFTEDNSYKQVDIKTENREITEFVKLSEIKNGFKYNNVEIVNVNKDLFWLGLVVISMMIAYFIAVLSLPIKVKWLNAYTSPLVVVAIPFLLVLILSSGILLHMSVVLI